MLRTKKADRLVAFFTAVMLIAAVCLWGAVDPVQGDGSHEVGYESLLFDSGKVHTIDITMKDWSELIANATAEEYRECEMTIDGENLGTVGIRAKGNTSLSSVATLGSERYSFKVEFSHYAKGKTYHGLDKLSLNNLIQDATMMKDYMAYTLMGKMGVPSSLCSYVQINVNGEPWGLYLAVEGVEDGFMERNGMTKGELYKPDSMSFGGGRGNGRDFDIENFREKEEDSTEDTENKETADGTETAETAAPAAEQTEAPAQQSQSGFPKMPGGGDFDPSSFGRMPGTPGESAGGGGFNFGMGSDDVKLVYTGDDPDSYSNIFNNAKTNIDRKDKTRLIEALKKLNAKEDLDNVVNKDEVITYLAVHNFLCNDDSYTGMMVHNYYLYEEKGKLSIIPWDYNLGFGGFSTGSNATSTVNSPIDNPVSSGTTESRPLIAWIFTDEEALAQYHETYSRFISECIESGWLEGEISRVQEMITPYLEKDTSAFYTMEEFEKAVNTLKAFCAKRGESVRGQLEGAIPSTSSEQRSSDALVDASDISTSDMGSMNSNKGGGGFGGGNRPGGDSSSSGSGGFQGRGEMPSGMPDMSSMPDMESMPDMNSMPDMSNGNMPSMPSGMSFDKPGSSTAAETADTEKVADQTQTAEDSKTAETTETPAKPNEGNKSERPVKPPEDSKTEKSADSTERPNGPGGFGGGQGGGGGFPGGGNFGGGDFPGGSFNSGYRSEIWIWTAACAAALILAVLIICKVRSHNN